MANDNRRKMNSEHERQQFLNFFEELSWLLDSKKEINFKNASKFLKEYRNILAHETITSDRESNEFNLIGVLPSLLKDGEIFQTNSQLVQFAEEVLALNIPRWEKKSRNEIIGLIVCEVEDVNKERLDTLAQWACNILNNKSQVRDMQSKAKTSGHLFSWNETIQKLVGTENE
ncbi:MAG TPA: hypothetical protein PKB13_08340 [Clostridia bacterium]|nr:hypothetical protein [Clostridia bacterium]